MGEKIVLSADRTLFSSYRKAGLFDFLGCIPSERIPNAVFNFIAPMEQPLNAKGRARVAPYGLRKVEAALLASNFSRDEVVVADPRYVQNFIDEDTEIVGLSTMDPLGLGPVSMTFTVGGKYTAFDKKYFLQLMRKLNLLRIKEGLNFKIVIGGSSAWQLTQKRETMDKLRIDHVVLGETEHRISQIFQDILGGRADRVIEISSSPSVKEIPTIQGGTTRGMVEVQRGCGRGCQFCDPNMRTAKYFPFEKIKKEIKVNIAYGEESAWLHSEDIFLYDLQDKKHFHPNREAVLDLFRKVLQIDGLKNAGPTHCSIAPIVDDPKMIRELTNIILTKSREPPQIIGVQPGLESGSPRILKKYMANKAKPFSPEEWPDIAVEATKILNRNHWYPAYTIIMGLPKAKEGDALETLRLIDRMEREVSKAVENPKFIVAPLTFVPLGALDKENTFDLYDRITETQFAVIYRCWRWIVREARETMMPTIDQPAFIKGLLYILSEIGGDLVLRELEKFARRRDFDLSKALDPP